jgi:hypothetical protein
MFRNVVQRRMSPIVSSNFIFDAFTDTDNTNLTAHTGDLNSTWIDGVNQNSGASAKIFSNAATTETSANAALVYTGSTPNNDCFIQAKIKMMTSISANVALIGRLNTASDDYYWVRHSQSLNQWQLRVTSVGTPSTLGGGTAVYNDTMIANDERLVKLEIIGITLKVYIDGVERISTTDSTHSSGRAGIRFSGGASPTTGYSIDDFTVVNL